MTEIEFMKKGLHNKHIVFYIKKEKLAGHLMDTIPVDKKQHINDYYYVSSHNAIEWKEAQQNNDKIKMDNLSSVINILEIERAELISK